jgi:uncharacterized protein
MRFNVSHLVKAPVGAQDVVHLDKRAVTLGDDLFLHYLRGDIRLTLSTDGLLAEGQLDTALDSECVRCLASFPLSLTVQLDDLTFALPRASPQDYLYRISENGWIDADQALSEQILLNIPLRPLCRPDCRGLCSQCGQNLNTGTCDCQEQAGDPRLAALRDLL